MKPVLALASLALACAAALPLGANAQKGTSLQGEVLEVQNVPGYTYLRLKSGGVETWAAVTTANVKKGAQVTIVNSITMTNFDSKVLKKHFDSILFGSLAEPGAKTAAAPTMMQPVSPMAQQAAPVAVAKLPKASGPDGRTVAEVVQGRTKLKDKTVLVRGQVVKVNLGIMGKNWLHLQDGSGSTQDGTNDVLVTTKDVAKIGDVITARGTVRTDVNLGSGYAYTVMIEEAAVGK